MVNIHDFATEAAARVPPHNSRGLLSWQFPGSTCDTVRTALLNHGEPITVRGLRTRELSPAVAAYNLGEYPHRAGMATKLGLVEGLMMVTGSWDIELVKWAAPNADPSLFGPMAQYGPRVKGQLDRAVSELRRDSTSRRVVLTLPRWTEGSTSDLPCTSSIQFLLRQGQLNVVASMRSWDAAYGMPTDLLTFGLLGMFVAKAVNAAYGRLTVFAGSLHGYETTISKVKGCTLGRASLYNEAAGDSWPALKRSAAQALKERSIWWLLGVTQT